MAKPVVFGVLLILSSTCWASGSLLLPIGSSTDALSSSSYCWSSIFSSGYIPTNFDFTFNGNTYSRVVVDCYLYYGRFYIGDTIDYYIDVYNNEFNFWPDSNQHIWFRRTQDQTELDLISSQVSTAYAIEFVASQALVLTWEDSDVQHQTILTVNQQQRTLVLIYYARLDDFSKNDHVCLVNSGSRFFYWQYQYFNFPCSTDNSNWNRPGSFVYDITGEGYSTVSYQIVAVGHKTGFISIYDSRNIFVLANITNTGANAAINYMTPVSSTSFAACSSDAKIILLSSTNYTVLATLSTSHTNSINMIALVSSDVLVTASDDTLSLVWRISSRSQQLVFTAHSGAIKSVVSVSNDLVATGSLDSYVKIWKWLTGSITASLAVNAPVYSMALLSSNILATGDSNGLIKLWYVTNGGSLYKTITANSKAITSMKTYNTEVLTVGDSFGSLIVLNWVNSVVYTNIRAFNHSVTGIDITKDSILLGCSPLTLVLNNFYILSSMGLSLMNQIINFPTSVMTFNLNLQTTFSIQGNTSTSPTNPEKVLRSSLQQYDGSVFCSYSCSSNILWTVYTLDQSTYQRISPVDLGINPTITSTQLTILAASLAYGLYEIRAAVDLKINSQDQTTSENQSIYIQIVRTGPTINALPNGATSVTIGLNQAYTLAPAVYSYDLDKIVDISSLSFKFYCWQNQSYYQVNNIDLVDLHSAKNWGIVPPDSCFSNNEMFDFDSTGNVLCIHPSALQPGSLNQFIVATEYQNQTYWQNVSIILSPQVASLPLINMKCKVSSFCYHFQTYWKVNADNNLIIDASCSDGCPDPDLAQYSYQVFQSGGNSSWLSVNSSYYFNSNTFELVLRQSLLETDASYWMITLTLDYEGKSSTESMVLTKNTAPIYGFCLIDLNDGYAWTTQFNIQCKNWTDFDGVVQRYEYFATYPNNPTPIALAYDYYGNVSIALPVGPSEYSNEWIIFVQVFDNQNAYATYYLNSSVQVVTNPNMRNAVINDLIMDNSTIISMIQVELASNLTIQQGLNSMLSVVSILDYETDTNETVQLVSIKYKLLELLSTVEPNDLSMLKLASSVLSSLTDRQNDLNEASAVLASSIAFNLSTSALSYADSRKIDLILQAQNMNIEASMTCLMVLNSLLVSDSSSPEVLNNAQLVLSQNIIVLDQTCSMIFAQFFLNQTITIHAGSVEIDYLLSVVSELPRSIQLTNGGLVNLPWPCLMFDSSVSCHQRVVVQQSFIMSPVYVGKNGLVEVKINNSYWTNLVYHDGNNELAVNMDNSSVTIFIPRVSTSNNLPDFTYIETTNLTNTNGNQLLTFDMNLSLPNVSIHFHLKPTNWNISYLLVLKHGHLPYLSPSDQIFDVFKVSCYHQIEMDSNELFHSLFANISSNRQLSNYVGIGVRELTDNEQTLYCLNSTYRKNQPPILYSDLFKLQLTSNFSIRTFTSGCYYLNNQTGLYSSYGVDVLSRTNSTFTACTSSHLTSFAGGFDVLPAKIDFSYVFANASFDRNKTIYLTAIIVVCLYLLLIPWTRFMDWYDQRKSSVHVLADNCPEHLYFYEIIVFTGGRHHSGTESRVFLNLVGQESETFNRQLSTNNKRAKILKRGGTDSFLMSVEEPLGPLNYMKIWHDNSGSTSNKSSWFLKFIIVHDIQTREQFYFICNQWLSVDSDDGRLDRLLPVCGEKQKTELRYLINKQTKQSLSDEHLWLSVLARPTQSSFSRTERLTCCLTLLTLTMLMNILYYDQDTSSTADTIRIGPMSVSQVQIITGVICDVLIFVPTFIIIQLFRRSKPRYSRTVLIKSHVNKVIQQSGKRSSTQFTKKRPLKQRKLLFPWWIKIFAYVFSFVIITCSLAFIIFKGISLGDEACRKWLASFLISAISSILLTQPLKVAFISLLLVFIFRRSNDNNDIGTDPNDNGESLNKFRLKEWNKNTQSPHFAYVTEVGLDHMLNDVEIEAMRQKRLKQKRTTRVFLNILFYSSFMVVLCLLAYSQINMRAFNYKNALVKYFQADENCLTKDSLCFINVKTVNQSLNWIAGRFWPRLLNTKFQGSGNFTYLTGDMVSYLVGSVTVRQLRVINESCMSYVRSRFGIQTCNYDYSISNEETREVWVSTNASSQLAKSFKYSKWYDLNNLPYQGQFSTYGGSGYVYKFDLNQNTSLIETDFITLRNLGWVDKTSRALFIQFTLYNPNLNLFAYCIFLFEIVSTGNVVSTVDINTFNLYSSSAGSSLLITLCLLIYMFIILLLMMIEIREILKQKIKYFQLVWPYLNWTLYSFSWASLVMFVYCEYSRQDLINKLRNANANVINFQSLSYWTNLLIIFIGVCVFIVNIKLLKLIRFSRNVRFLQDTFKLTYKELAGLLFISSVVWFGFVNLIYLYFVVSPTIKEVRNFVSAMETTALMLIGRFDSEIKNKPFGPVIYVFFQIVMVMMLLNLILTVLCESFNLNRREYKTAHVDNDQSLVVEFIKVKLEEFKARFSRRRVGTQSHTLQSNTSMLGYRINMLLNKSRAMREEHHAIEKK